MTSSVKFYAENIKVLQDPVNNNRSKVLAYVDLRALPTDMPMEVNPRGQRLTSHVSHAISKSILDPMQDFFHVLNRGITISATNVQVKKNIITMDFVDPELHGVLDGGHSYKIICRDRALTNQHQYVFIEILEGYEDILNNIANARNTSVQVKEYSILNNQNKFEMIKEVLKNTPLCDQIAFRENDTLPIHVEELIALFYMFDVTKFHRNNIEPPIVSAIGKAQARKHYVKMLESDENSYEMMKDIMYDIVRLHNYVELNMPDAYKTIASSGSSKVYFGRVAGITSVSRETKNYYAKFAPAKKVDYVIPKAFTYPIVASLRYLLTVDSENKKFKWVTDPFLFLEKLLPRLTEITVSRVRSANRSIMELAKDKDHWNNLYREVEMKYLRDNMSAAGEVASTR